MGLACLTRMLREQEPKFPLLCCGCSQPCYGYISIPRSGLSGTVMNLGALVMALFPHQPIGVGFLCLSKPSPLSDYSKGLGRGDGLVGEVLASHL